LRLVIVSSVALLMAMPAMSARPQFAAHALSPESAAAASPQTMTVSVFVTGGGTLKVGTMRLACPARLGSCSKVIRVEFGRNLAVRAQGPPGSRLKWSSGCTGNMTTCSLRIVKSTRIAVTFIPLGAKVNPIPLGQPAIAEGGWSVKVLGATPDATQEVVATRDMYGQLDNETPPAGAQYYLVSLAVTYLGGGSRDLNTFATESLEAVGSHGASYSEGFQSCGLTLPSPDLAAGGELYSGQTTIGNVCWEIASNDAGSLQLQAYSATLSGQQTYFALH
jgi:hypothetical protein